MRQLYFLLPGTDKKFACGGLWAELKTLALAREICPAQVVTYRQREPQTPFLDDLLQEPHALGDAIFVMSWGFDVAKLAPRLKSFNAVYHAHSSGYGFRLPARVPIITVSRNTLGYWGQHAPHSLLYYLPNEISEPFKDCHQPRDIDVLVHARKSSQYLLHELIPALEAQCNVFVIRGFIDDFAALFNRAKVYLYDSAEYWALQGVSEGFGLQPLEAIACGCQVFSSVNGGLSDYLDPGFNCHKIAGYSASYDLERILSCVRTDPPTVDLAFLEEYRRDNILLRLETILKDVNAFFDARDGLQGSIAPLTPLRIWQMRSQTLLQKVQTKLLRRKKS
ncbi:glycosyltransferase [Altericista sp. CCNU0014]|uniref:glycosyltransferase n=1 Tax=Altericista sp. CCNU0014 TaxID=3082949 RepID=UPI00384D1EEB